MSNKFSLKIACVVSNIFREYQESEEALAAFAWSVYFPPLLVLSPTISLVSAIVGVITNN